MAPPRLDPWRSVDEWRSVSSLLFSGDPSSVSRGLSYLRVWSLRSPRLPLAVECTAELLRACQETGDPHSIVSTYCLAIIRFVNGYVDRAQVGAYARPAVHLGAELGIPEWVVYLRHDATHKDLPPLREARAAARCALRWLRTRYWEAQVGHVTSVAGRVAGLLDRYVAVQEGLTPKQARRDGELSELLGEISSLGGYETGVLLESLSERCLSTPSPAVWDALSAHLRRTKPALFDELWMSLASSTSPQRLPLFSHLCEGELLPRICYRLPIVRTILRLENSPATRRICHGMLRRVDRESGLSALLELSVTGVNRSEKGGQSPGDLIEQLRTMVGCLREREGKEGRFVRCHPQDWYGVPLGALPPGLKSGEKEEALQSGEREEGQSSEKEGADMEGCTEQNKGTTAVAVVVDGLDGEVRQSKGTVVANELDGEVRQRKSRKLEHLKRTVRLLDIE